MRHAKKIGNEQKGLDREEFGGFIFGRFGVSFGGNS